MRFIKIITDKKFTLIAISLFLYVSVNLFDGERGLISFYEKSKLIKNLSKEKNKVSLQLRSIERENYLLTEGIDLDYLEILYRKKFMVGKPKEKIFKISE